MLRLLDKEAGRLDLAKLGMAPGTLAGFDHLVRQPHGIVLVTGPTGSRQDHHAGTPRCRGSIRAPPTS
ncbi:ATPase, T2SS/T4P/T4SS family [Cupriavidus basilensis]